MILRDRFAALEARGFLGGARNGYNNTALNPSVPMLESLVMRRRDQPQSLGQKPYPL